MELLAAAKELPYPLLLRVKVGEAYIFWRELNGSGEVPRERVQEEVERNL